MNTCPGCKKGGELRKSSQKSFWEAIILPILLLRPYDCESCGIRFYGFRFSRFEVVPQSINIQQELGSSFLDPKDNRDFKELVQEIRKAERQMGLTQGKKAKNR